MKAIITVIGKDRPGIIAGISAALYQQDVNILDVAQTVMDGYFTMTMLVDLGKGNRPFDDVKKSLKQTGAELGMEIRLQRVEIFDSMHQI